MHSTAGKGWNSGLHGHNLQPQQLFQASRLLGVQAAALLHPGCRTCGLLLAVCA